MAACDRNRHEGTPSADDWIGAGGWVSPRPRWGLKTGTKGSGNDSGVGVCRLSAPLDADSEPPPGGGAAAGELRAHPETTPS